MDSICQKNIIESLTRESRLVNSAFLVARDWWTAWEAFTASGESPGPVNNAPLLDGCALKAPTSPNAFVAVSGKAWAYLLTWFGGGPAIEVPVREGEADLNVVWVQATTYELLSENTWKTLYVPVGLSGEALKAFICNKFRLAAETALIQIASGPQSECLAFFDCDACDLPCGAHLVIEVTPDDDEYRFADHSRAISTGIN